MFDLRIPKYNVDFLLYGQNINIEELKSLVVEAVEEIKINPEGDALRISLLTKDPKLALTLCADVGKLSKIKVDEI